MLQSMTGFGNFSVDSEMGKISVDIKTLNSKNLDLNYNLSPFLKDLENDIRLIIMSSFKRGKVDIKINFKITQKQSSTNLNRELIKLYIKDLQQIVPGDAMEFLKIAISLPNSIENNQSNLDNKISNEIKNAVKHAVKMVIDFRKQEGNSLKKDILNNASLIQKKIKLVEKLAPKRIKKIKKKINKNLVDLNLEVDLNRFHQELIYHLEKLDINEELVRLNNHLIFLKKTVNDKEIEKGKKLTFIGQEIGREINTIGSKSNHLEIQQIVVEMKNELEKIKEQLLNVL
jgi:uncharacterized protein (TIGR00255 family)